MAVHTYHREQRKAFYREHVWELMFQKTDSSIYICMIRPKEQIYPSAQVINSPPPVSADGTKNLTSDIQYCKLLRQMVSVTQFVYHRWGPVYPVDARSDGESS